jgi:ABC-type polysaccharide/polyol phosphate transport system ATPase subunit
MAPILAFDRVWKQFRRGQAHDSLRDLLPAMARRLVGRGPVESKDNARRFWALRDVTFEVKPGEVLGIIGHNGAGKSTALKLLNRIMDPTGGDVRTRGRIGALIEISAGFHQDLTGRQNIYLQGAIMGMRKVELERKFDEIVAFSGVEDFLDTPVKRYSSGMNARLGFSIAAHLEPDILIIDEVLSVGDAAFQQKAFARIKQMATGGAPVVLVSHQLDRIAELCTKAILLDHGSVRAEGTPDHCIKNYLHGMLGDDVRSLNDRRVRFESIVAPNGHAVESGQDLTVIVTGRADIDLPPEGWTPAFRVRDIRTGADVHSVTGFQRSVPFPKNGPFEYELTVQMNVQPGTYQVQAFIWDALTGQEVVHGSSLLVEVIERMPFYSEVQLNSRWRVRGTDAAGSTSAKPSRAEQEMA